MTKHHHTYEELGLEIATKQWGYPSDAEKVDFIKANSEADKRQVWLLSAMVSELSKANKMLSRIAFLLNPEKQKEEAEAAKRCAMYRERQERRDSREAINRNRLAPFLQIRRKQIDRELDYLPESLREAIHASHMHDANSFCEHPWVSYAHDFNGIYRCPVDGLRETKMWGIGPARLKMWDDALAAREKVNQQTEETKQLSP